MYNMIGMLGSGALGLLGSLINTAQVNKTNKQIADSTNRANRQLVEMQNAAAKQESELAYQRSKPTTQVGNLMQAGMSRAGAINTLSGGGSYTPAPVNTSQDSAPQMQTTDLSALTNVAQAFAQRSQQKHDEKMQAKQLAAAKEQQNAQLESNERIAQLQAETTNRNADNRLNFDKDQFNKLSPYQIRQIESTIDKIKADTSLTKKQEEDLAYRLGEFKSQEYKTVRDAENLLRGLQADFEYKITEKSFADYLNENYDYVNGEYVPKKWISNANKVQQGARAVWNTIFELIPVNLLLEALGGTVDNVRALKMLSKFK